MFRLAIVTPEKILFDGEVRSLVVPGSEGYLGVLANHAPLISALQAGKIQFTDSSNQDRVMVVSRGFFEVANNAATVLADQIENANEINIESARAAYRDARQRLNTDASLTDGDRKALEAAMRWHAARIKVHEDTH